MVFRIVIRLVRLLVRMAGSDWWSVAASLEASRASTTCSISIVQLCVQRAVQKDGNLHNWGFNKFDSSDPMMISRSCCVLTLCMPIFRLCAMSQCSVFGVLLSLAVVASHCRPGPCTRTRFIAGGLRLRRGEEYRFVLGRHAHCMDTSRFDVARGSTQNSSPMLVVNFSVFQ